MPRTRLRPRSSALRPSRRVDGGDVARVSQGPRRRLAWVAVPTALAALGSGVFVNVVAPRYTGEATILMEGRAPWDGQAMASQIQATLSRDLAKEAVRRLKLVGNPEFDPTAEAIGPVRQVMMLLGLVANPLDRPSEDWAIEGFLDHLRVAPGDAPRTLAVAFESTDARLAAEAANTVAQLSLATLQSGRAGTGLDAPAPPDAALVALRRRVAEAEAKVEAYRARHGLSGAGAAPGQPLSGPQMTELSNQLTQARLAQAEIAGRVAAIRELLKDGRAYEIGDVATTDTLRRMIDNRIATRAQLALESRTLLPAHPRIKELKAQLADLDNQIKTAAERAVLTLENDAKIAGTRVTSLQASLDSRQSLTKGNPEPAELTTLERGAKALRQELAGALTRPTDLPAPVAEGTGATARIATQAVEPTVPSFPDKGPIVGLTTLLAFLLSLGGVLTRAVLGRRGRIAPLSEERPLTEGERTAAALLASNPFTLPEAMPPSRWQAAATARLTPAATAPALPAVTAMADPSSAPSFDIAPLVARLSRRVVPGSPCGRTIVVVDAGMSATGELHAALAKALRRTGSVIAVDLGAPPSSEPGLTDAVDGSAAFADVIRGGGLGGTHRVATGRAPTETLFDEPRALAFTLEAMAEAYGWVLCRLHRGPDMADLLSLIATLSDSVVIASDADPADPELSDLYGIATEAGAGQVLIAQDRPAPEANPAVPALYDLAA